MRQKEALNDSKFEQNSHKTQRADSFTKQSVEDRLEDQGASNINGSALKTIVLPAAAIGLAVYGISKLIQNANERSSRQYYYEPIDDFEGETYNGPRLRTQNVREEKPSLFSIGALAGYLPVALKVAKAGVNYLEANGTKIHPVVKSILGDEAEEGV